MNVPDADVKRGEQFADEVGMFHARLLSKPGMDADAAADLARHYLVARMTDDEPVEPWRPGE